MLVILSKYSYMELDSIAEFGAVNTLPSETQPDEVLTVREMLENHARGIPMNVKDHYYDDDDLYPDLPDLDTLDLVEVKDLAEHYKAETKRIQHELQQREKVKKQEKPVEPNTDPASSSTDETVILD